MPRPKRPRLVQTVPSSLRVAKPAQILSEQDQNKGPIPSSERSARDRNERSEPVTRGGVRSEELAKLNLGDLRSGPRVSKEDSAKSVKSRRAQAQTGSAIVAKGIENTIGLGDRGRRFSRRSHPSEFQPRPTATDVPLKHAPLSSQGSSKEAAPQVNTSRRPSLTSRLQSTPLAQDSALGAFRFRRRARQPSLLQVAQSQQDNTADLDDLDFQEFLPDDESTPLIKSLSQSHQQTSSSSQQTSGSRKRKLANPEVQVLSSQPRQGRSSLSPNLAPQLEDSFDLPPDDEDEALEPTLPTLRRTGTPSLQIFSDTLAPPQSSSPVRESVEPRRRKKPECDPENGTNEPRGDTSQPICSPVSTSSGPRRGRPRKNPPPTKPLTTARLQNLLPRRRARPKRQTTYDIPSSSDAELDATNLGEDEDELSFHATNKMRRKKTSLDNKSKRGQGKLGEENTEQPLKGKRASKTYSRRSIVESCSEDDEGGGEFEDTSLEVDGDTGKTMPVLNPKAKAEMKRLADKFKEVDDFALDFEDMTGSSSQMKDAR